MKHTGTIVSARVTLLLLAGVTVIFLVSLGAFRRTVDDNPRAVRELTGGGDWEHGRQLISQYGCGSCHTIPGVEGARGNVGPPLATIARRSFIGGVLPNSPENMIRWIQDAPGVDPMTAMPNMGVTHEQARHIAAYLYAIDR